ncbi:MAG: hypothetical protein ABJG68_02505 [Crocinitomicaceae bacterium]
MGLGAKYRLDIKFILLAGICCMLSLNGIAQKKENTDKADRKIRWKAFEDRKPGIMRLYTGLTAPPPDRPDKFDRFNTDFFWNSWIGDQNGVETKFYAIGHAINLMFDVPFDKKGRVGIGIGLGYSHFNVRHNGQMNFVQTPDLSTYYTSLDQYNGPNRWINRTVFNFLEVPFELRFRSASERRKFKFYPGFKVGYMFEYFSKWRIEGAEYKEFNFPDVNRLHYGPSIRIGLDNVMLFGYYDMAPLFTHESSSKLQLFGAGISIGWF